ncbi:hypothetical protein GcC1_004016 [Golovinomyces cichoracearum]|uniref:Btz domain-containing protein n=1 Tax=Golovinomyces cichoracearum TaxID=62708 RepID=A0A420J9A2_9PEZI|nr:hypothetical protein GcC1_004016 [Golovinomyces cichoracearum]
MVHRKRKDLATIRRRVEDDGDEEGGPGIGNLEDDSFSEESVLDDEINYLDDEHSQQSEVLTPDLPESEELFGRNEVEQRKQSNARISKKSTTVFTKTASNGNRDLDMMLNGISLPDEIKAAEGVHFNELTKDDEAQDSPAVIRSNVSIDPSLDTPYERRRREHEEYKKKRLEDPAFVPNRGAFFMHDHRHSGPAANGFRPFSRGRGRGRLGYGASFAPHNSTMQREPLDAPWTHDMHEIISKPAHNGVEHNSSQNHPKTTSRATICTSKSDPASQPLSMTKPLGVVPIRIALPTIKTPIIIPGISIRQYTRLPDHRPPLRRDKPVRIFLPYNTPRYIFPAVERSFVFIPRAMRPNQQGIGARGRGWSAYGSGGGYSRRTSVFDGSIYESGYTPSIAMSRRSSLAHETTRDTLPSPTGSALSRPQTGTISSKPVVRLPPSIQDSSPPAQDEPPLTQSLKLKDDKKIKSKEKLNETKKSKSEEDLRISELENASKQNSDNSKQKAIIPKPQSISVVDTEAQSGLRFNPPQQHQQPFHQQVPTQVNGLNYSHEAAVHSRSTSYPSQTSTGTPLSQIPELAIYAQPFQPNPYQQQQFFMQPYQMLPQTHGYYCPPAYNSTMPLLGGASSYVPLQSQQFQPLPESHINLPENPPSQPSVQNLIAQEVNGTIYYYDAAQIPAVPTYPAYQQQSPYPMHQSSGVGNGTINPSAGEFYFTQTPQGIMYRSQ